MRSGLRKAISLDWILIALEWILGAFLISFCCCWPSACLSWHRIRYADPGPDEHLHGRTLEEITQELGSPTERPTRTYSEIGSQEVRSKVLQLYPDAVLDEHRQFAELIWVYKQPGEPPLLTWVWFHEVNGQWVAFHSYRHYKAWAGP